MMKFEHQVLTVPRKTMDVVLSASGGDGWQLVSAIVDPADKHEKKSFVRFILFLKREKR